jgi:nitrate reductase NapAB chaperone NapD
MKNFPIFILISASKALYACGYYPYGEDTRISLFNPSVFGYNTYSNFYYSVNLFSPNEDPLAQDEFTSPNCKLWFEYCGGKVDIPSIQAAVYELTSNEIHGQSQNAMIRYLVQQKDSEALDYLHFAKNCEFFNSWQEDPWERNENFAMPKRTELMNRAIAQATKIHNELLKKRYTFLAIRLAWYNHHFDKIQSLFASVFEKTADKDILYYWSLYFKSLTEEDKARTNFDLAQVFANAADKRFVCHQNFKSEIPLEQTLQLARTNAEKANVYLLYGVEKPDKALPYLNKMYELNPASDGLSFLLLREINKIEDYVLTPYYTLFQPSLSTVYWGGNEDHSTLETLNRAENDRLYAKEVLQFVNSIDLGKVENAFFWRCSKANLQYITRSYDDCLTLVNQLQKLTSDLAVVNQLNIIQALAITAKQTKGKAVIPSQIQVTIIENQNNGQLLFAIGKELEYLGNTTDAALLYAKIDKSGNENSTVFWKTLKNKRHSYTDYFVNYFDYTDAIYTPEQTQDLIDDIQKNKDKTDDFSVFKYETVKSEIPRLYDLLGTKYIRQNKLGNALSVFGKIDNQYWTRNYTAWGDREAIFDQNPFYRLKYTPEFIPSKDPIRLSKYTVTKQLIGYLHKAENKNEKDRDYYYFIVGNAYYNMGRHGNVYMMRRINGWSGSSVSLIEDEIEFRQSNLAKKYYLLAKKHAQTDKFKALCLRMATRCEKDKLDYYYFDSNNYPGNDYDSLLTTNQYYRELKEKYPDYFEDLVSTCNNFQAFFDTRR